MSNRHAVHMPEWLSCLLHSIGWSLFAVTFLAFARETMHLDFQGLATNGQDLMLLKITGIFDCLILYLALLPAFLPLLHNHPSEQNLRYRTMQASCERART
jgi:hypothetical protein